MDIVKSAIIEQPAIVFLSQQCNTDKNTISDICDRPRQIQRYSLIWKQYILVCCCNNWISFHGSVSLLLLHSCIAYLSPSMLSILLFSSSLEQVIHRSGNPAVFSLSPAFSRSVTWLKTDVRFINRRQKKADETSPTSQLFICVVFRSAVSCHR